MPGPPPIPTEVLKLRGSVLAKKRTGEPQPRRGFPEPPATFGDAERGVWDAVCKILDDMGVLTLADAAQLERYAVYFVRWRACIDFLRVKDAEHARSGRVIPPGCYPVFSYDPKHPWIIEGRGAPPGGKDQPALVECRPYPTVNESLKYDKALKQIEAQFGLTPAARARITPATSGGPPGPPAVWSRKRA